MDKPTNPTTIVPFGNDLLTEKKVSHEAVWGGVGMRFPHPEGENNEVVLNKANINLYYT